MLLIAAGSLFLLIGLALLIAHLTNPASTLQLLPGTASPVAPTTGYLGTPLAAPPLVANMPIMPVIAVQEVVSLPALPPSLTPSPVPTLTATQSPTDAPVVQATIWRDDFAPTATHTPTDLPTRTPDPTLTPTLSPTSIPQEPDRLLIPSINLDAPILKVWLQRVLIGGELYSQWGVPDGRAVGWHETSAMLGQPGNTVLNGHHNVEGRVLARLVDVQPGDKIILRAKNGDQFDYTVVQTMLLLEEDQPIEQRLENARWLLPSADERITLVTCWPPGGYSHRLVVVALPSP